MVVGVLHVYTCTVGCVTTAKDPECGAVILLDPLISFLDEHAYGSRCCIEVSDLQSLHHLPVPACEQFRSINLIQNNKIHVHVVHTNI